MNIVFDLDGTLIDSALDIHAAVNRMLADEGLPGLDQTTVTGFVGNGLPVLVRRVMAHLGLPEDQHERLTAATLAAYSAAPADLTRPYPGVAAALRALQDAGHRLGLCTNKPEGAARVVVQALDLTPFFVSIVGGGRLPVLKPDPAMLRLSIAEMGGGDTVFVGDSEIDADTATAAGVPFYLFTEGYRKSPVARMAHHAAFADFAALPGLIAAQAAG